MDEKEMTNESKLKGKLNKESVVNVALSFKDANIDQRTPRRVEHRRADLVRKRRVHWVKADAITDDSFDLELEL